MNVPLEIVGSRHLEDGDDCPLAVAGRNNRTVRRASAAQSAATNGRRISESGDPAADPRWSNYPN